MGSETRGESEISEQITMFPSESQIYLKSRVTVDEKTDAVTDKFDYLFDGEIVTKVSLPNFPIDFQIGLIVGSSGSGKTTLLRKCFGEEDAIQWNNQKAIISNFDDAENGMNLLCAVGLSSIPSWCKPYKVLSNGEKFRADLARRLHDGAVIDEFTSVVNREAAKACSYSVQKYIRQKNLKNIVFASCHDDIAEYLQPDWIYNTDTTQFYNGRYLQRPPIELVFHKCTYREWPMFQKHHYLSNDINKACRCVLVEMNGCPVAFVGSLAFPFGGCSNAYRESRLVVLPDFQGVGIGNAVSETIAQMYVENGYRYFSKTANPRCGVHRDKSLLWKATSHNHKARADYFNGENIRTLNKYTMNEKAQKVHAKRICYSHEYVGNEGDPQ